MKKKKEKKKQKREKKKRKSIFIFQHVTDETAMAPKNAMHQYSQHYQTHANGESNRVTGGANPRADLPPTQLMHSFYIILHARSFSGSVDRLLSGSISHDSIHHPIHHPPSDSPSTIRSA